jgi:hypothetical protein
MPRPWQRPKCRFDPAVACRSLPKGKPTGEIIGILREAEVLLKRWRTALETQRPHSSLGYRPRAPETILLSACPLAYA